jgi:hypothetical protein
MNYVSTLLNLKYLNNNVPGRFKEIHIHKYIHTYPHIYM